MSNKMLSLYLSYKCTDDSHYSLRHSIRSCISHQVRAHSLHHESYSADCSPKLLSSPHRDPPK